MPSGIPTIVETAPTPTEPVEAAALAGLVKLATHSRGNPMLSAVVAAVLSGALFWGLHEALGGQAALAMSERLNRQDERIERIEKTQDWIRWSLLAIAEAVDAKLPPMEDRRP